jgi:two-component system, chemotaxis family, chemotaxis protein CheY
MQDKIKVLIVDDSLIIREAIHKHLKHFNIEVVGTAENGKVALELFKEKDPDVVTLDITMPEIDGLTVLAEMLKMKEDIKVMVVTALSDKATGLKAIKLGAKSFLPKPFTPEKIQESFQRLVGQN